MPAFTVPRHVSAHRISAIALYRALLQQCRAVPLPAESKEQLQNVVRNRFKQVIHLHSYPRLRLSFQAGHEAIDRLDASAAGDEDSTRYIASLLARTPEKIKAAPPRPAVPREKRKSVNENTSATKEESALSFKPSDELFQRPRPLSQLSGKRHVPVLFSANRFPVLRIKKPQPESLSSVIRNLSKTRQKRIDRHHLLADQLRFAQYEDMWDRMVANIAGQGPETTKDEPDIEPPWAEELEIALEDVDSKIQLQDAKNLKMSKAMLAVVDREKKAYAMEKEDRRQAKERMRTESRKAREVERGPSG